MSNDRLKEFAEEHLGVITTDKPQVLLPGPGVTMTATATALYQAIQAKGGIFFRGNQVVRAERHLDKSLPFLSVIKASEARTLFEEYVHFCVRKKDAVIEVPMSKDIAEAMLCSSVAKQLLPNVSGLINTPLPILHRGAFVLLEPGYDARTGLFVTGTPIQEAPTLKEAIEIIETSLADFTFQTHADIGRAIAGILTPALKFGGFLNGTIPIEIIEADESQSGKGYLALRRAAIYGETPTTISQQQGGVGSVDEKFASALVKGRPFILFDNWRGRLESTFLESYLTAAGNFSVRIPHAGESYVDPSKFCVTITSNGLDTTEDLANRSTFIRLKKEREADVLEIAGKRMLETIQQTQPAFLGAVTKVVRHWFEQGMPRTSENRHSFAKWAQSLDWIVQNIFKQPPLLDGMTEAQQRIQSPHLTFLRLVAIQVEKKGRLGKHLTASDIVEICETSAISVPGLSPNQSYSDSVHAQRIGSLMKAVFEKSEQVVIEHYRITRSEQSGRNYAGNSVLSKSYEFTRTDQSAELAEAGPGTSSEEDNQFLHE